MFFHRKLVRQVNNETLLNTHIRYCRFPPEFCLAAGRRQSRRRTDAYAASASRIDLSRSGSDIALLRSRNAL
jgi:hypothetical protein